MKQDVELSLWDTAGQAEHDKLRRLHYDHTDCFVVCFSVVDFVTFENVKLQWLNELRSAEPDGKILLVGTKADLRAMPTEDANKKKRQTEVSQP